MTCPADSVVNTEVNETGVVVTRCPLASVVTTPTAEVAIVSVVLEEDEGVTTTKVVLVERAAPEVVCDAEGVVEEVGVAEGDVVDADKVMVVVVVDPWDLQRCEFGTVRLWEEWTYWVGEFERVVVADGDDDGGA